MLARFVFSTSFSLAAAAVGCAGSPPAPAPAPLATPPGAGSSVSPAAAVTEASAPADAGRGAPAASASIAAPPAAPAGPAGCRSAMFDEPEAPAGGGAAAPGTQTKKQKPFAMTTQLPSGRLGGPALDAAARSAMTAWCAGREQLFVADARREEREGRASSSFYNECTCTPSYASDKLVSVVCSNQASFAGAHPGWRYAGFTFTLVDGQAKAVRLEDVCAPAAQCAKRITELLPTLPEGPTAYHEATLAKYLAKPTFALGPTALRILVDEDLSGYAAHGLSCDVPYSVLGPLARLKPAQ